MTEHNHFDSELNAFARDLAGMSPDRCTQVSRDLLQQLDDAEAKTEQQGATGND